MRITFSVQLLFAILILASCSDSQMEDYSDFTEKKPQSETERTVRDLVPVDSLIISEDIPELSLSYLELSESSIYSKADEHILKLNKRDLSRDRVIKIPEGRGPGEVVNFNVIHFKAGVEGIAIYDRNAQKTILYDLDGNFQEEFLNGGYQMRNMAFADERTYYFQIMPTPDHEYLFYEVIRNESESVVRRRFQLFTEGRNLLAYGGTISYHDNSLYYAGRSEPILRRYDLSGEEAELVFSRAVIEDYDSKVNYVIPAQEGGVRRWSYTDWARFASEDIAVDGEHIYTIEELEGTAYLMKYPMPEMDDHSGS